MTKNKDIKFEDITENIINNLDKPLFTYEEKYTCDEVWKSFKKNPFSKQTAFLFTILLFFTATIYIIIHKFFSYLPFNFIAITIILIIVFLIVEKIIIYSNPSNYNNKIFFYSKFLLIKKNNILSKYEYNEILKIEDKNYYFIIYIDKYTHIIIENKKIDNQSIEFLKNIHTNQNHNQNKNIYNNDVWNLDKYIEDANILCDNIINKNSINEYCHLKNFKIQLSIKWLLYVGIPSIIILSIKYHSFLSNVFYFLIIGTIYYILLQNSIINYIQDVMIKYNNKNLYNNYKIYFYDNYILLKTNIEVIKINFKDIKNIAGNDNYIFIELKLLKSKSYIVPLIIDKNKLKKAEVENIYKVKN